MFSSPRERHECSWCTGTVAATRRGPNGPSGDARAADGQAQCTATPVRSTPRAATVRPWKPGTRRSTRRWPPSARSPVPGWRPTTPESAPLRTTRRRRRASRARGGGTWTRPWSGAGTRHRRSPPSAPWTPQIVTGAVAPVPGLPGVPIGVELESAPSHVPRGVAIEGGRHGADRHRRERPGPSPSSWSRRGGLARVVRGAVHGHDDAARVDRNDAVDRSALAPVTRRQIVDEREPRVGHAHAVGRAVDLDDHTAGRHRHEDIRRLAPAGSRDRAVAGSRPSCSRRSPQ